MRPRGSWCQLWKNWSTHDPSEGVSACTGPCCWPWPLGPPGTFFSRPRRWWRRRWQPSRTAQLWAIWDLSPPRKRRWSLPPETPAAAGRTRGTFACAAPCSPPGRDGPKRPRSRTFCLVNPDWGRTTARNRHSPVRGRRGGALATHAELQNSKTETGRVAGSLWNLGNRGFFWRTQIRPAGSRREPRCCAAASGTFGRLSCYWLQRGKSGNYFLRSRPGSLPNEFYSHWLRSLSMNCVLINWCSWSNVK